MEKDIAAMHILVTGGTGLIGRALVKSLLADGHVITVLTRQSLRSEERIQYIQQLGVFIPKLSTLSTFPIFCGKS